MLTTTTRPLLLLAAVAVPLLTGCPETLDDPMVAGKGAAGNSAAVAKAIADAKAMQNLPKLPDLDKLCALQFGSTSFPQAKEMFGKPDDESMDKSKAGLSYRYAMGASIVLTFDWHDGEPGWGTIITGLGWDESDLVTGYLLSEASIIGAPYPQCWPHEEP
jgi:hypothetical protein